MCVCVVVVTVVDVVGAVLNVDVVACQLCKTAAQRFGEYSRVRACACVCVARSDMQ